MADRTLSFTFLGQDKSLGKTLKNVGGETEKTHSKLGALAGAFAGGALATMGANFLKGGLADIKAAAAASAQTAAVIKSTGGAAGVTQAHIEGLADSLEKMSGVAAENIQAGQNMLLTFTNIKGVNFDAATKTALDMSVALGTDASSSAMQLGKALNDPIKGVGALSKVGVTFDASQRKAIKSMVDMGDTAGAQQVILKELGKEFGGSAKAAGETMAGKMEILKAKFGDVRQQLVEKMLPALSKLMDFITTKALPAVQKFGNFLAANAGTIKVVAIVIASVAAPIYLVVQAIKAWRAVQVALDAVLSANPIGLIVIGLAALAVGLIFAYKHSETFRDIVKGAFSIVLDQVILLLEGIKMMLSALGHIPGFGWAKSAAKAVGGLVTTLKNAKDAINGIPDKKHVTITAEYKAYGANALGVATVAALHGRASGGQVFAGGDYVMGEQGPEVVHMGAAGTVSSATTTARMLGGGGGGVTVIFQGDVYGSDADALARKVQTSLLRIKRQGGTNLGLA